MTGEEVEVTGHEEAGGEEKLRGEEELESEVPSEICALPPLTSETSPTSISICIELGREGKWDGEEEEWAEV